VAGRLAAEGAAVAVFDRDQGACEEVAAAIGESGARARGYAVDVTDRGAVDAAVAAVGEHLGVPQILVNSAGIDSFIPFLELGFEEWQRTIDVNLSGVFHCCQAVLPHMVAAQWGRIVNISSSSTQTGTPRMGAYVAAKSGVNGLTKCLALEFARHGVTVNAIPPGFIDTPMLRAADAAGQLSIEAATKSTPVGRPGRPEDIAAMCAYLCRDEAGYVTGQTIGVNGGRNT